METLIGILKELVERDDAGYNNGECIYCQGTAITGQDWIKDTYPHAVMCPVNLARELLKQIEQQHKAQSKTRCHPLLNFGIFDAPDFPYRLYNITEMHPDGTAYLFKFHVPALSGEVKLKRDLEAYIAPYKSFEVEVPIGFNDIDLDFMGEDGEFYAWATALIKRVSSSED